MRKFKFLLILLIFIYPAAVFSSTIAGISTHTVDKADMNGMRVDIDFADSSGMIDVTEEVWGEVLPGYYGVSGTGWSLVYIGIGPNTEGFLEKRDLNGDLLPGEWFFDWRLFTDYAIDKFTIHALPGNTVFDIVYDSERTPGSEGGIWWPNGASGAATSGTDGPDPSDPEDPFSATFDWEFTDAVNITGESAQGDLFSTLSIEFESAFTGEFSFIADTDNITPVPSPSTITLLGLGLLGLCAAGRKD